MKLKQGQKIVFFGDSITRGFFGGNYITILEHLFSESPVNNGFRFINAGRDGDMVGDLLHRAQSDVLPYNPDWVIILVGLNDVFYESMYMAKLSMDGEARKSSAHKHMLGHFRSSYSQLIDTLKDKVQNIVICTTTAIEGDTSPVIEERLALINGTAISLSYEKNCYLVDLHASFKGALTELKEEGNSDEFLLTVDGVHLNKQGAELVAKKLFSFFMQE